jgi:serine/threonine-protein kinase HipA
VLRNGIDLSRSVENEHLCMLLTAALGLPTAKTSIASFAGSNVLIVERFDRQWTKDKRLLRLPQEDLCQALSVPPVRKYQSEGGPGVREILQFLKTSDDPHGDRRMFMKAQVVFWLLGATDGHAKNFSIFLHPGGGFRLTPLYDVMSLQPAYDANHIKRNRMKLAMAMGNQRHYVVDSILPRHFIQSAEQAGMPASDVEEIMQDLAQRVPAAIAAVTDQLPNGFPRQISIAITRALKLRAQLLLEHLDA